MDKVVFAPATADASAVGHVTANNLTSNTLTVTVSHWRRPEPDNSRGANTGPARRGFVTSNNLTWLTKTFHALPLTVQ